MRELGFIKVHDAAPMLSDQCRQFLETISGGQRWAARHRPRHSPLVELILILAFNRHTILLSIRRGIKVEASESLSQACVSKS